MTYCLRPGGSRTPKAWGSKQPESSSATNARSRSTPTIVRTIEGVDLDLAFVAELDSGCFEPHAFGVRLPPGRKQYVIAFDIVTTGQRDMQRAVVAPFDPVDRRVELEVDALAQRNLE